LTSWREEDVFTVFLGLSVICHGMFFWREWLVFGSGLLIFRLLKWIKTPIIIRFDREQLTTLFKEYIGDWRIIFRAYKILLDPRGIFLMLIAFSLLGLFHPIRSIEGWLEAFRWLVFLAIYLWGKSLACSVETREKVVKRIVLISLICTIISWLPGSEMIWASAAPPEDGRFALCFGYPNAAAVFIGCQLLLLQKENKVNLLFLSIFLIGIVCTGSRSATVLLLIFSAVLTIKKVTLNLEKNKTLNSLGFLGFKLETTGEESKSLIFILLLLLFWTINPRFNSSLQHLLDWTGTSLNERIVYYLDSIRLAWSFRFLPEAGGWLAFPFRQTISYWTLNPHSSVCSVLLNQGLAGVVLLGIWGLKGFICYLKELIRGKDLTSICSKTAVLYLGLHSLMDTDISFGTLGMLFWLLTGMYSK